MMSWQVEGALKKMPDRLGLNLGGVSKATALALILLWLMPSGAIAAQARPWLCRDKPVFSSSRPMHYELRNKGLRHWRIFFMQFTPGAAHDGFTIAASSEVAAGKSLSNGELNSGQFFAVALYASGSHWVCPEGAETLNYGRASGVVSRICYRDQDGSPCRVDLTVREASGGGAAFAPMDR